MLFCVAKITKRGFYGLNYINARLFLFYPQFWLHLFLANFPFSLLTTVVFFFLISFNSSW